MSGGSKARAGCDGYVCGTSDRNEKLSGMNRAMTTIIVSDLILGDASSQQGIWIQRILAVDVTG